MDEEKAVVVAGYHKKPYIPNSVGFGATYAKPHKYDAEATCLENVLRQNPSAQTIAPLIKMAFREAIETKNSDPVATVNQQIKRHAQNAKVSTDELSAIDDGLKNIYKSIQGNVGMDVADCCM